MAALNEQQKLYVVQRLACYHSLSEVRDLLKDEYGVDVETNQLARYNPLTLSGADLSQKFKDVFQQTRDKFVSDSGSIPIALKSYRLQQLQRLYDRNRDKSPVVAADLLKQAAMEQGDAFANRRDVNVNLSSLSDEQLENIATGKSASGT